MTTPAVPGDPAGQNPAAVPAGQAAGGSGAVPGVPGGADGSQGRTEPISGDGNEGEQASHREQRYRQQLRATEGERDQLQKRLDNFQRGRAAELADQVLEDGSDLWTGGVRLADLIDADGELDPSLVRAAAEQVLRDHRHWGKQAPPARIPVDRLKSGASSGDVSTGTSWADVLRRPE